MSVYRVLDKLEAYVHEGTWLPAGFRILSEERLMEFIEKVRSTLPEEVGRAKTITREQDRMIRAAQDKAQAIVTEASTAHEQLVQDHEIVQRARTTAEQVLREAEARAQKVREGADHYAAQMLAELEGRLQNALGSVRKGRETLSAAPRDAVRAQTTPAASLAEAAAKSKRAAFDAQADDTATLEAATLVKK